MVVETKGFRMEFDDHMVVMEKIQMLGVFADAQFRWIDEQ